MSNHVSNGYRWSIAEVYSCEKEVYLSGSSTHCLKSILTGNRIEINEWNISVFWKGKHFHECVSNIVKNALCFNVHLRVSFEIIMFQCSFSAL